MAHRARFWVQALSAVGEVTTIIVPIAGAPPPTPGELQLIVPCEQLDHPWLPALAQHAPEYLGARWADELAPFDLIVGHRSYVGPFCVGLRGGSDASLIVDLDDDDAAYFAAVSDHENANRFTQLVDWLHARTDLLTAATEVSGAVVIPNSVPLPMVHVRPPVASAGEAHIVMVGNFTYAPNVEGARWFEDQVFPAIVATHPDARLTLAGPGSTDVSPYGIGFVDDLSTLYNTAAVAVVPILTGSGSRIKALEAWAHGVPVVGTSLGLHGLDAGAVALVADHPALFAQSVTTLLDSSETAQRLGAAGRSHVEAQFSEGVVAASTTRLIRAVTDGTYRGHVAPIDGLAVTEVEDGLVVYEPSLDTAHRLNSTAAIVFTLADRPRAVHAIAAEVAELFGGEQIDADVLAQTVDDLVTKRLLARPDDR